MTLLSVVGRWNEARNALPKLGGEDTISPPATPDIPKKLVTMMRTTDTASVSMNNITGCRNAAITSIPMPLIRGDAQVVPMMM